MYEMLFERFNQRSYTATYWILHVVQGIVGLLFAVLFSEVMLGYMDRTAN